MRFEPKRLREERGDTPIERVALAAQVSVRTIQNWERGVGEPKASQLQAIASLFGVELGSFYTDAA